MRFSVIMPSRLKPYRGCADNLENKILRAIRSVLDQSFTDFELIVIADECELTKEKVKLFADDRIVLLECAHKAAFDNTPRNTGLDHAKGDYIIYCDIDDYWGPDHLKIIDRNLKDYDWVWYNDIIWNDGWIERACNIKLRGGNGTSNICHARRLNLRWEHAGYSHDHYFNQKLLGFPNHTKIETPEYYVCHIPLKYDR